MSDNIEFNPDRTRPEDNFRRRSGGKGLAAWLVRNSGGLIKDESKANALLILIAIICFGASIVILLTTFN